MNESVCAVVLAERYADYIKTDYPKALCQVLFKPMIGWVTDAVKKAGIGNVCATLPPEREAFGPYLPDGCFIISGEGGEMTKAIAGYILKGGFSDVLIVEGDRPMLRAEDIGAALALHRERGNDCTALKSAGDGYSDAKYCGAAWLNAGFAMDFMRAAGDEELDIDVYAGESGCKTGAYEIARPYTHAVNSHEALALLNQAAREDVFTAHYENGVHIPITEGVIIGPDVEIGPETLILPGTILKGGTTIGPGCEIGPNSYIDNGKVGAGCKVLSTYIDSAELEPGVKIGPMSNVRPDTLVKRGAKIGDFVELKNSVIGERTSVSHLTYIGDSDVGSGCNIGCGVVTSNYDGTVKSRTVIGDNAFIGCNTNLVAPVKVGNGAYSAAGTTVTEDVPPGALVIGRARQSVKEGWAEKTGRYVKK